MLTASQKKISFKNSNNANILISAVINFPEDFNEDKKYPAIIVTLPSGSVKEQMAGLYARKLSEHGFITIAYDPSYQGESTGAPRLLENPHIRTEDVSAVLDYLTTLPYINTAKIGAVGICGGGGYTINAAINDHRIKAVGTISVLNVGAVFRNGWANTTRDADAFPLLLAGAEARTADAKEGSQTFPLAPEKAEDAPNEEWKEVWEYYRTDRCQYPTAPSYATSRSLTQIATYDAFSKADIFLTQPLLSVIGSRAGTSWMSDVLLNQAASTDKNQYIVEGASHVSLYDVEDHVNEAVHQLTLFFQKHIA
ncbi:alpha/beta hydrolase [Chitinophaga sp. Mgbs1]|uniref:Alpha/beta hydrolase n=1 Tax=Chitinophaga solisilvae TaxID=1233460 RepID=A0A9Q5GQG9_9BACT|nr:alpha/beta hydrolase [Chitinophaga solisilvae]